MKKNNMSFAVLILLVALIRVDIQAQTPIASYSFTGNANDASANANNATVNGATLTADRFGNANSAYSFDGVSNFINIPHIAAYNTSSYSVSMWYKYNGPGTAGKSYWSLIGKNDNGNGFLSTYQLHIDANNKLGGRIGGGSLAQNIDWSTNATINNAWHQVTYVFDNTKDSIYVYQDGAESYRDYFPFNASQNSDAITLGVWNPFQNFFNGSIDEVNIYGDPLTAAQVLQNYNSSIGLVAHYPFSGNANDASGNALNGTSTGTVTPVADKFGNANSASNFNGASRIDVADNSLLHPTNVTLSAWIYFTTTPGTQVIANKNIANSTFESYAIFFFNGNIAAAWGNPGTVEFMTGPVPTASQWHFVAMTFDDVNNLASLYLDGVLVNSQASNLTLGYDNSTFSIATELENGSYNFFYNGIIDEVKIYNTALSAAQVLQEFQAQPNFTNTLITNGTTTFASTPNGMMDGLTSFTYETWIKTTENKSSGTYWQKPTILGNVRGSSPDGDFGITTNSGMLGMWSGIGVENTLQTTVVINDNLWHHVAAVKDAATLTLFCDGINIGSIAVGAGSGPATVDAPLTLGGSSHNGNFGVGENATLVSTFHQGEFAETRFSNNARYTTNFTPATNFSTDANTVALYHYGACQREICADVSGNSNFLSGRFSAPSCATTLPYNNAISYNGVDQKAFLPTGMMNGLINFTIEGWIKSTDVNSSATANLWEAPVIVSEENPAGASGDLVLVTQAGYLGMTYEGQGNGVTSDISKYFISDNQWHHWAVSADGSTVKFFVDGIIQGSRPVGGGLTIGGTDKFALMGDDNLNTYIAKNHSGLLEEVRFSNTARYTSNFAPPTSIFTSDANTVALYHSDDCPNNNLTDASTNNNTASLQNFNGNCQGVASQKPGSGNAISFDGGNDEVNATQQLIAFDNFTIEAWVNPNATTTIHPQSNGGAGGQFGTNQFVIFPTHGQSVGSGSSNAGAGFTVGTNGICVMEHGDSYIPSLLSYTGAITGWTHVAIVYTNKQPSLYVNGILVATGLNSLRTAVYASNGQIGGGAYGHFNGQIDEVRIWNSSLTQTQIRDRMCHKINATDLIYSNLVSYYNFDESTGTAAFDGTVNANNGILVNGSTRVTSGAAIGNTSTHNYITTGLPAANLSFNGEDNLAVTYTAGTFTGEAGTHVYAVNEKPNTEAGINGVGTNDRYFGVFNANLSAPAYTATYNYNGNPFVSGGNENVLTLFKRNDNAAVNWTSAVGTLNTTANTITATGQNTEYMLGLNPSNQVLKPGSGNALSFDGVDDHITTGSYLVPTSGNFTAEMWVFNRNNTNGFREFISQGASGDAFYMGTTNGTGIIRLGDTWQSTGVVMPLNQWVHLAVVKSGTNGAFYINGVQVATNSNYATSAAGTNTHIGRQYGGLSEFPDANLDEIRIWNTALTQAQIRDRMCHKISSSDPLYANLVAYYNFDESTGSTAFDGTANANNGTLINGPTRITSGAAIGNTSAHNYVTTGLPAANLSFNGQDNLDVAYTTGTFTGEAGTHIYAVNEKPNTEAGINGVGTNDRYFGVFNANLTSPSYTATYNYDGNPFVTGGSAFASETDLILFKRTDNSFDTGTPWSNTNATLNTNANTLTVIGQNTEYMLGSVPCTNPTPTITSSGATTFCQGDSVTLSSSAATGNLWSNGATTQSIKVTTSGLLTVINTDPNGCTSDPSLPITVTVNALPILQNVTGGGNYCSTPGTGVSVGLSGSEIGVTYQLEFNTISSTPIGLPVNGTGLPLTFGNQTAVGNYTVTAQSGSCTATMSGSVSVSIINPTLWYIDFDNDGYGNAAHDTTACTQPIGFVNNNLDCNDTNANVHPGNSGFVCATVSENQTLTLTAPGGSVFTSITFASYGDPNGSCGNFTLGGCHAANSKAIVESVALNQNSFSIGASNGVFGDPCVGVFKRLYVQAFYGVQEICNGIDDDCNGLIDDGIVNVTYYADADSDGFGNPLVDSATCIAPVGYVLDNTDCDDNNTNIHEPVQYFVDADHDGFGSTTTQMVCATTPPLGFSLNNTDCDDGNANINTPVLYFVDADQDGFGSTTTQLVCATTPPIGFSLNNTDCNDTNNTIHPGAIETCNGIDDNCNGTIDEGVKITFYQDFDNDGFGNNGVSQLACAAPIGYVLNNTDCNDTSNVINPNAIEICNNGIDDNCNGQVDEGCNVPHTYYEDLDEDFYGNASAFIVTLDTVPPLGYVNDSTDCDDLNDFIFPGQTEYCNGIDDDCDGLIDDADSNVQLLSIWYQDLDNDGYGNENITIEQCDQPTGYVFIPGDCNDTNDNISPDAIDYCNQIDDNCDGIIDNGFNTPPTLSFLGTGAYTNSLVDRPVGNPTDVYKFRVLFTDAENDVHLGGYPKLLFDYEGDGIYTGSFDKQYVMQESDVNDVISSNGKEYFINLSYFKPGLDYHLKVVAYDEAGCIDSLGPFNSLDILELPNAFLFASDITMSNYNPDPGDTVIIQANIHYTSLNSAFDTLNPLGIIVVHLLSENETYKSFADDTIGIGATNTTAEWTVIANDTGGWYPFRVFVDYPNQIIEANEFDNDAVRAYVVGKDALGGKIDITANASPPSQYVSQGASVSICGHASYSNIPVILSNYNVAGAEVSVTLIETGQIYKGTTNSNGDFCVSFYTPVSVGVYHVSISITDFTLIGICPNPPTFELVQPACILDLAVSGNATPSTIVQGDLMSGTYSASNAGCQNIVVPTKINYSAPGSTVPSLTNTVNPLVAGTAQNFSTGSFTYNTPGTYQIEIAGDANNDLIEINEANNYFVQTITVLPNIPDVTANFTGIFDVKPQAPGTQVFQCLTYPIRFVVSNIGGGSTGAFLARGVITNLTANTADTFDFTVPGMSRFSEFTHIVNYDFTYLGNYKIDVYADIPLNNGVITPELSENNNFLLGQPFEVIECKPDLAVNCFYITPKDPEIGGNVTANFVASNVGTLPVTQSFDVTCNVNSITYTQTVTTQIPVGSSQPMSFTFPIPPLASGFPLLITLDQNNVINEFDETNNTGGTTLCYDFAVTNHSCKDLEYWEVPHMVDSPVVFSIPYFTGSYLPSVVKMKFEVMGPGLLDGHTFFDIGIHTQNTGAIINPCAVDKICPDHFNSNVPFFFPEPGEYYVRSTIDPQNLYPECNEFNNSIIDTLEITDLPDYQVLSQYINPSLLNPNTGQPVTINVTYENVGANDIGSNVVHQLQVDNTVLQDKPVASMIGGDVKTTVFDSTWMSNIPGTHIMRTTIDPYNTIVEGNEGNNTASRAIIVGDAPNLYWATFDAGLVNCNPLCQTTFTGKIVNDGDLQMQANVTYYYVAGGLEILIQTIPIQVGANDTIDVSYIWQVLINNATIIAKITDASPDETLLSDNDTSDVVSQSFLTLSSTKVTCPGDSNGTATANVSGGVSPYAFAWSNGSTDATIITVAGTYTVTVTDAIGYNETLSVTITEKADNTPPSISNMPANIVVTDTNGNCSEAVTWLLPLISDNCSLASSTASHAPGDVFPIGSTQVTYSATDAGGLNNTQSFIVTVISSTIWYLDADSDGFGNPDAPLFACSQPAGYVSDNTDCDDSNPTITTGPQVNAGNDTAMCKFSSVQLTAVSNGNQYSWKPATGLSSTVIANPLATPSQTTTYTVTVTAGNGCTSSDIVKVTVLGQSPLPVVQSPIGYCKNETAQALTANGLNLMWYTSLTGGTGTTIAPTPSTNVVGSVKYYVTQSVNGCESERAEIEVITNAKPVINSTSVSCNNGIGAITITTFNNVGRMEYSLDGINYQPSSQFTNVVNGTYVAYLRDTLTQCVTTKSNVKVNCKTCDTITVSGDTVACVGDTIAFTQSGGKQNGYWIANNGGTINISTGVFSAYTPGTFAITYFDDVNFTCFGSTTVTVNQVPQIPQVVTPIIYCEDELSQALTAVGTNLIWYNSATDSIGSTSAPIPETDFPGSISYFVTQSNNNCISTKAQIDVNTLDKGNISNVEKSCVNGKGTITVAAAASSALAYSLDGINYQNANQFDNLIDSTYSIYVKTDSGNCITQIDNIDVNCNVTGCNITINGNANVCFGSTENYTQTGGNPNGKWSISGNVNKIDSITGELSALWGGNYIISYTDPIDNCIAQLTIKIGKRLAHSVQRTLVTCNGGNDGAAVIIPKNLSMPYQFLWSNGKTTAMVDHLSAGLYIATLTDTIGCFVNCQVAINQNPRIFFQATINAVSCPGGCDGKITTNAAGGVAPYTYLWSNGNTDSKIKHQFAGNYTLTITDSKGCTREKTFVISQPPSINISFVKTDETQPGANDGTITATTSGGNSPYTYLWSNGKTTAKIKNLAAGSYQVTVTDVNDCFKRKTVIIETGVARIGESTALDITVKPNPARDFLYVTGIEKCTVQIYNSIGVLVYENNLQDGTVPISNLTTGVYSIQFRNEEIIHTQKFVKQ